MKKTIALTLLAGFLFVGCTQQSPSTQTTMPATQEQSADSTSEMVVDSDAAQSAANVKEFTVAGNDFSFDVKEMRVKKGDTVRITFENKEGFHDWVVDEFSARTKQLKAGETETIEFVASQAGEFEYYCSVGQHRQNGMVGMLIVEE